jgi:hypothetical protein
VRRAAAHAYGHANGGVPLGTAGGVAPITFRSAARGITLRVYAQVIRTAEAAAADIFAQAVKAA